MEIEIYHNEKKEDNTSRNKQLLKILQLYKQNKLNYDINYNLFNLITIAFLKENNETIEILLINKETRDELYSFVDDVLKKKTSMISNLIDQYLV